MSERGPEKQEFKTGTDCKGDDTTHLYKHKLGGAEEATVRGWGMEQHKGERTTLRKDQPDTSTDQPLGGGGGRKSAK